MIKSIIKDINILKKPCSLVSQGEDVSYILKDLEDTLESIGGVGLAANQIGYNKKVAIVKILDNKYELINPTLLVKLNKFVFKGEKCFSFPGIVLNTDRYAEIFIEFGFPNERKKYCALGLEAIAIQHEVDHLNGVTFFDKKHRDVNRRKK